MKNLIIIATVLFALSWAQMTNEDFLAYLKGIQNEYNENTQESLVSVQRKRTSVRQNGWGMDGCRSGWFMTMKGMPAPYKGIYRGCSKCSSKCLTCYQYSSKCTSCRSGYMLVEHKQICRKIDSPEEYMAQWSQITKTALDGFQTAAQGGLAIAKKSGADTKSIKIAEQATNGGFQVAGGVVNVVDKSIPSKTTPVQKTPVQKAPVPKTPVQQTPIQKTTVQKAPVQKAPVQKTPVQKAPVQKAPVQQTPVKKSTPTKKAQGKCGARRFENDDGDCEKCDDGCETCSRKSDECSSCQSGWYLEDGQCEKCQGKCPSSGTGSSSSSGSSSSQKPTPSQKNQGKCGARRFENDDGECEECDEGCETCSRNSDECSSCQSGWYLEDGQCEECDGQCPNSGSSSGSRSSPKPTPSQKNQGKCGARRFENHHGECEECDEGCETCSRKSDECSSCYSGWYLEDGQCEENDLEDLQQESQNGSYAYSAVAASSAMVGIIGAMYLTGNKKKSQKQKRRQILSQAPELKANQLIACQL